MMTSHLKLFKLFCLGHNAEDVSFCSLRVEILIESLHTMKGEEIHVVNCFQSGRGILSAAVIYSKYGENAQNECDTSGEHSFFHFAM